MNFRHKTTQVLPILKSITRDLNLNVTKIHFTISSSLHHNMDHNKGYKLFEYNRSANNVQFIAIVVKIRGTKIAIIKKAFINF